MKKLLLTALLSVAAGNLCAMGPNESNNNNNANNNNIEDAIALMGTGFAALQRITTDAVLEDLPPMSSGVRRLLDLPSTQRTLFGSGIITSGVSRGASSSSSARPQIHVDHQRLAYVRTNQETSRSLIPQQPAHNTIQDQEATALELGSDPHRYGAIAIDAAQLTEKDRNDARTFAQTINNASWLSSLYNFKNHPEDRIKIAKAVMCGEYSQDFMYVASKQQDYPLLEILLRHKADPNRPLRCAMPRKPALALAQSPQVACLLVQHGASMKIIDPIYGTLLHQACHHEYQPKLLAYYLQHAGIDVNNTQSYHQDTPLHKWATFAFAPKPQADDCTDAQEKLTLLIQAGAALNRRNEKNETPLNILKAKRKDWLLDGYRTNSETQMRWAQYVARYDALIAQLSAAIQAQNPIKPIAKPNEQTCAICLDDESEDTFCALACKHVYHKDCIDQWLALKGNCPMCRLAIVKE